MTALPEEIEGAIAEGCRLFELRTPLRIEADKDGNVKALIIKPQKVGEYDASGRPKSYPAQKNEQVVPCDIIIGAIGQEIDFEVFEKAGVSVLWNKLNTDASMRVIGMTVRTADSHTVCICRAALLRSDTLRLLFLLFLQCRISGVNHMRHILRGASSLIPGSRRAPSIPNHTAS